MITEADFQSAAALLSCDVAAIQAVAEVESSGAGFLQNGRVRILFEGHIFYRLADQAKRDEWATTYPDICHPKWTHKHYCKGTAEERGAGELDRFERALRLDTNAALQSCSVGKFQICGFNFKACGFDRAADFWAAMEKSEGEQLRVFCRFIMANPRMWHALKKRDWATFARLYNGPGYSKNKYDQKMAQAFARFQGD